MSGLVSPAARGLRVLAVAADLVEVAEAGSLLGGGGIVDGRSAVVFPAAAVATPVLLGIVEQGHLAAREAVLGVVDEAVSFYPQAEYARVTTSYGKAVPICCAIVRHV
ncbi:hypothetical protein [Actinacidiphila sp. bgisy167]|uniref:hypothetical protein n=1 Tax=Actinacidiphila sp. bgisy167 TaxID=3413797 RepID=UPI003D7578DB